LCPSYFLLIKAWTEIGCGLGLLVAFGVGAVLGRAVVAEAGGAVATVEVAAGAGDGDVFGSAALHAISTRAAGSTHSTFI
jgi:hypothetical protein